MTTAKQAQRTPGPWQLDQCKDDPTVYWLGYEGTWVGKLLDNGFKGEFTSPHQIISQLNRACNAHDALVAALRGLLELQKQRDQLIGGEFTDVRIDTARAALAQLEE